MNSTTTIHRWRVMRVTNVSTGEATEIGIVQADDAEMAQHLAGEMVGDFQTFRIERITGFEERYDELLQYRDRSYVIQPDEHVGHVVQIVEADPIDYGALRGVCSCGQTWALDELALRTAFGRNIEVKGPGRIR